MNSPPTFLWKIPQFKYRKISKISPEAYTFQRPFLRGLCTEENFRFKVDRANLIVGRKFTVFALFYFAFEGNFPSTSRPPGGGGVYLEGRFNGGFLRYRIWGLIFGGAYTWRGLFSEFYGRIFNLTMSVFCSNTNFCSRMLEMHSKRPRLQNFSRNSLLSRSQITSLLQVFPSPPTPHLIEKPCIPDID